jgi:probable phosphoglycerate mutase
MTTLLLVRHAAHALVGKALVGRAPGVALSPEGVGQAERLRDRLAGRTITRVLSSPIQRALETAAIVAAPHGVSIEQADELTEIDCGAWTGSSFDHLAGDQRWHVWNSERAGASMPGGESMEAVQARTSGLIDRLAQADTGPVMLVSHSDVIKAVVSRLIDVSLNLHDRIVIDPASVTTVELWGPGQGRIVRMNEVVDP